MAIFGKYLYVVNVDEIFNRIFLIIRITDMNRIFPQPHGHWPALVAVLPPFVRSVPTFSLYDTAGVPSAGLDLGLADRRLEKKKLPERPLKRRQTCFGLKFLLFGGRWQAEAGKFKRPYNIMRSFSHLSISHSLRRECKCSCSEEHTKTYVD